MRNIIIGICLAFLLASCQKEEQLDATFTMEVKGFVEEECYTFGEPQALYLWSSKSWADGNVSQVTYEVDPTLLEEYNQEAGTSYQLLPDTCYWMENSNFNVDDEAIYAKFKVMYSPESIIASGGHYGELEYALPMRLLVNGVPMGKERGSVIVAFRINEPLVTIERSGLVETVQVFDGSVYELTMPFSTNYNNKEWVMLDFEIDNDFVEAYNAENGTEYLPFPQDNEDYVTWIADEGELERNVNLDSLAFFADMQSLESGKQYMLAVKLAGISTTKAKIDSENFRRYVIFAEPPKAATIPQTKWSVVADAAAGTPAYLIDDNLATQWTWNYRKNPLCPQDIVFNLKRIDSLAVVQEIEVYGRDYSGWEGPKTLEVYTSLDGLVWEHAATHTVNKIEAGPHGGNVDETPYTILLSEPKKCTSVKVTVTESYDDGVGFYEIYMKGKMEVNPDAPETFDIPQEAWTVMTSSDDGSHKAININDYDRSTYWLWDWSSKRTPEDITFTLVNQNQTATVDSIGFYPFVGTNRGWKGPEKIEIQIDKDGSGNWETVVKEFTAPNLQGDSAWDTKSYSIILDEPVQCKAIRVRINSIYSDGVSYGEIVMFGELK